MHRKIAAISLVLIVFLAAILRLYRITVVPPHLYWDEASIAYNAYSINTTGRDEWGRPYPLLFESFGDNKLPLFIYLVAVFQRFLGFSDLSVRFPSALAGILTVLVSFFLVKELVFLIKQKFSRFAMVKNENILPLFSALFLAVSSWHLQFSRAGFEANVALLFRAVGVWLFLLAIRKDTKLLLLSVVFFVAGMYTYHSAALTAPLILGFLVLLFARELIEKWRHTLLALVLGALLLAPYLPTYMLSAQGRIRFNAESVATMPGNTLSNFLNNYVSNFSLDYLFFRGDQNGRHSVKKLGELYLWQLPAVLAGTYFLLRFRSKASAIIIFWLFAAALPPALTRVSPHALRGLLAVHFWQILSAVGVAFVFAKGKRWWRLLFIPVFVYALFLYLHHYYIHYPGAYAPDWQDGQKQAVTYLFRIQDKYERIFVDKDLSPIYLLWYLPMDPRVLWENGRDLTRIGKYQYTDLSSEPEDLAPKGKNLLVVPSWMGVYPTLEPLREIRTSFGKPVFRIYEY